MSKKSTILITELQLLSFTIDSYILTLALQLNLKKYLRTQILMKKNLISWQLMINLYNP